MNSINYTRQYWDEFTVFVENFDSLARIEANNGSINGNFSICEGRFGTGGCFDGNSSYIDYGRGPDGAYDITDKITIEAWAKPNGADENGYIAAKCSGSINTGYSLYWSGSNDYISLIGAVSDNPDSNAVFTDNNVWVHAAITVDGNSIIFYRNGVAAGTATDTIPSNSNDLSIGDRVGGSGQSAATRFNGTIDEVRISNIARVPVSQLWTLNYTLSSSEAMTSGNRYYWKIRALDQGGEQG